MSAVAKSQSECCQDPDYAARYAELCEELQRDRSQEMPEPLDILKVQDWQQEVELWAEELLQLANSSIDPEHRQSIRRRIALLLGLDEYAWRYQDSSN